MHFIMLDNIDPYEVSEEFCYMREEAECQGFSVQYEAEFFIRDLFEQRYPLLYSKMERDDLYVEYDKHEVYDNEETPTYAVYIYVSEEFVILCKDFFPHWFL